MINRQKFFDGYRDTFGSLTQDKVSAINFILDKLDSSEVFNLASEYANILAQIKRETGDTYEPRIEGFYMQTNRKKKLYNYYLRNNRSALKSIFPNGWDSDLTYEGRGRFQTTHWYNYDKIGRLLGMDLVKNPDLLLDNETDWQVLELCLSKGIWTGKKLSDYINENKTDYEGARRVVNGTDHAKEIAKDSERFYEMIDFEE